MRFHARKHNPFIAVNCGAIPEGTIDSELFGHEKGSFTGAVDSRKGYFETVNGGTIFLDEIGEMPLGTQARLLRVLETGEFIRVGSSKVRKTDVRVIAATNKDLLELHAPGKIQGRPLLSLKHGAHPRACAARSKRRYPAAVQKIRGGFCRALQDRASTDERGCEKPVNYLSLARKCAGIEEYCGAGFSSFKRQDGDGRRA